MKQQYRSHEFKRIEKSCGAEEIRVKGSDVTEVSTVVHHWRPCWHACIHPVCILLSSIPRHTHICKSIRVS